MIWFFWRALLQDEGWQQDQPSHAPPSTDSPFATLRRPGKRSPWQTVSFGPSSFSGCLVSPPNRGSPSFADSGMPEERKALWTVACLSVKQWAANPENFQRLRTSARKHEIKLNGRFATWTVKCGPRGFVKSTILNFNWIYFHYLLTVSRYLRMGRTDESTEEATIINIKDRYLNINSTIYKAISMLSYITVIINIK